jgi:DNA-binding transcriptional LysR family regulator
VLDANGISPVDTILMGADLAIGTAAAPLPYAFHPLVTLPVWAYVPPDHPWAALGEVTLPELLTQPLVGLPRTFTARQALESAMAETDTTYATLVEASNGTVAQALAAAGRGVAVVSDDPRFDLVPIAIRARDRWLSIRLIAVWDSRQAAAKTIASIAQRLGTFATDRYDLPTPVAGQT